MFFISCITIKLLILFIFSKISSPSYISINVFPQSLPTVSQQYSSLTYEELFNCSHPLHPNTTASLPLHCKPGCFKMMIRQS